MRLTVWLRYQKMMGRKRVFVSEVGWILSKEKAFFGSRDAETGGLWKHEGSDAKQGHFKLEFDDRIMGGRMIFLEDGAGI